MKRPYILKYLICTLLSLLFFTISAQFTSKQHSDIRKKAVKLLITYADNINQLGKDVKDIDKTRINIEELISLFVSRKIQVYNDLDPSHQLSEYYEAETYASNLALWYPAGIQIKMNLDNAQVSNVIKYDEELYSIDFLIDKAINGMFHGTTLNNNTENLLFRIVFMYSNGDFQKFRIAGIRKAAEKAVITKTDQVFELKSAQLTTEEKREIDRETFTLLKDYSNYLSMIGDTIENIEDKILYKESFRSLFTSNQSPVYNDVSPDNKKNLYVPVSDYINLYSEAYASDGGTVLFDLDSADLGYVMRDRERNYLFNRIVKVNKSFTGNYLGKRKVSYQERIAIKIFFGYYNNVFKNFRIDRIDITAKKAETIEQITFTPIRKPPSEVTTEPTPSVPPRKNKFMINAVTAIGLVKISEGNLSKLTISNFNNLWQLKPGLSYSFSGQYTFLLSSSFGLHTGIGYSLINTTYSLNSFIGKKSVFLDPSSYYDINNTIFYRRISANYDSSITVNLFSIPVGLSYYFKVTKNIQAYIKSSINTILVSKANAITEGFIKYYGYFPSEKDSIFRYKDWPEYGFFNDTAISRKSSIKPYLNNISFSSNTTIGLAFSLSSVTSIALSGNLIYSLTSLVKDQKNYLKFYRQSENNLSHITVPNIQYKPVRILDYGVSIEFIIKL